MSKCDLLIVLDKEDGCYEIGEQVSGVVQVKVNDSCNCKKLTLTRRWGTHGRGNKAQGPENQTVLFSGTLQPGQHEYPFTFPAPAGPLSYHGHNLNVDWYLRARIDLPWAIDPKAETEFLLARGEYEGDVDFGQGLDVKATDYISTSGSGGQLALGCFGLIFTLAGLGFFIGMSSLGDEGPPLPIRLFPLIFVFIGLGVMFLGIRNKLAERKLGGVDVTLSNYNPVAGEEVVCTLNFSPKSTVKLNAIFAELEGEEVVTRGSGSNRTTYHHSLYEQRETMIERKQASVGRQVTLEKSFLIPEDAPASFKASDNALSWKVTVSIDIPGWPDWSKELPVTIG